MVLFSPFSSIQSTLVLFSPFCPLWSYVAHFYYHSVQCGPFGPILFTSVPFGPILSTSWISLFFPPFSRNTNRTKKYVYGERSCERQGWRYLHNDIYIYINIFWIKHISRPYLVSETTRENEKKKKKIQELWIWRKTRFWCVEDPYYFLLLDFDE